MSYILDALRRSDQDRRSGEVPDLQSQPDSRVLTAPGPFKSGRRGPLLWILFLSLLVAVCLGWMLSISPDNESSGLSEAGTTVNPHRVGSVDAAPVVATEPARQNQVSGNEIDLRELQDVQLDVSPVDEPEPSFSEATTTEPSPAQPDDSLVAMTGEREAGANADSPQEPAQSGPRLNEPSSSTESSASGVDAYEGIPHQRQLTYDLQSAVPKLNVSVHVYSTTPSSRLVRINNKIYREGDVIDSELKLEEITQDGLIMSVRDNLFWRHVR